jgi:hypothetical protein
MNYDTVSRREGKGEGPNVKPFNAFVSGVKKEKQYVGSFIL